MDTIFALATARGKAGVSVVRLSGPDAHAVADRFVGDLPKIRQAGLRVFRDNAGDVVDQALVLVFEQGASFTGEKVVEFQLHGSPAVVAAVLECFGGVPGCRHAEAGEFTRRALENNVLGLAEIEGLGDLIEAETEAQRRQAVAVFSGALGDMADRCRAGLLRAAALMEATIDFVDEEVPVDVMPEVREALNGVLDELRRHVDGYQAAERVRDGFEVALVGPTNVGKSTLLNRLAGREAAITSEIAGTTRDVIEVRMDIRGLSVTVLDTAGVRESVDAIEVIGIERAVSRARGADLRVILLPEVGAIPVVEPSGQDIVLVAKADKIAGGDISGIDGQGVEQLLDRIGTVLEKRASNAGLAIKVRHKVAMEGAIGSVERAVAGLGIEGVEDEIVIEDLRAAVRKLDILVGRIDVEHILGEIFSRFCIGK